MRLQLCTGVRRMKNLLVIASMLALGSVFAAPAIQPEQLPVSATPERRMNPYQFKGWHLALLGSFGLSNPNASFSKYISGTEPAFKTATEGMALFTYYWDNGGGVSFGSGYALRNLAFKDSSATANYPMQFVDLRAGYRMQSNALMIELGVLYGATLGDTQVTITRSTGSSSSGIVSGVNTKGFFALYMLLGINYPLTERLFGLLLLKLDYGLTPAVAGDWPLFNSSGIKVSQENVSLIPFNLGGTLGLSHKF